MTDRPEPREEGPLIRLEGVSLTLSGEPVLRELDLVVHRGETVTVLGASGAGKSTILRLMLGLQVADGGRVLVGGRDVAEATAGEERALRREMGMVFQYAALFDSLSVFENVAFPLREFGEHDAGVLTERVEEVLEFVDLEPERVAPLLPAQLSGGMKKRVGIARAIVARPAILLFDEPTSGLDPITTRTINRLVRKLQRELGVTSVLVTHDISSAFRVADRVALLHDGRIVFDGTPDEMTRSDHPYVKEFLGDETEVYP